jgi:hypothetical protein
MLAPLTILCVVLPAGIAVCQQPAKTDCQANLLSNTATAATESMPKPSWTVKYLAGSLHLDLDTWLRIAFAPQSATLGKKNLFITVRADQIASVEYNAKTERDSDLLQGPRSGCSYARSMMPDMSKSRPANMIAIMVTPGRASRLADKLIRRHPVHFVWIEEGKQEQVSVSIKDCEYESFIANLRWLLETRWGEVARDFTR